MRTRTALLVSATMAVSVLGCRDDSPTGPAGSPTEARVFTDDFVAADFQAFGGSKLDAVQLDTEIKFRGTTALRVTVPAPGDPNGGYAGGAFVAGTARDLTRYNALTFYARASQAITLDVAGLGNDNTGNSQYTAERRGIALTTTWQKVVIPIPLGSKLTNEAGLFFFAEGAENASGYTLWFDDVQFETLTTITSPRPALAAAAVTTEVGATQQISGLGVTFSVDGADNTVLAAPRYFTFASSNAAVASVNAAGLVNLLAAGSANITASLNGTPATGAVEITAVAAPSAAAPTPTRDAADVISLFSDAYTDRSVDTWSAEWDQADVTDVAVGGNAAKRYANFVFAGIEFTSAPVNATTMTHFHVDVYANSNTSFRVKLVDFGANGIFGGGDDTEHEVVFDAATLVAGAWNSLDIPLASFVGMTGRGAIAQLIIGGSSPITYIDNVYFYRSEAPTAPVTAAPTPTYAASDVVSLFSNAYTNSPVDTWSAPWDAADVTDLQIAGNDVKRYSGLGFAGIEFVSSQVNATTMTHFRLDIWTPNATTPPAAFKVKLVDFGANGAFGGGDDREHELTFTSTSTPALGSGAWVTLDIPLSQFIGLTTRANLAQLIIVGEGGLNTLFVDNVLFHR